jgi:hypothetical protein
MSRHERGDVIGSPLQRLTHLALVLCSIVDPSNAGLMAADVVQYGFDYVRQDPKPIRHHCRRRSAKVVETPGEGLRSGIVLLARFKNSLVKRCLRL